MCHCTCGRDLPNIAPSLIRGHTNRDLVVLKSPLIEFEMKRQLNRRPTPHHQVSVFGALLVVCCVVSPVSSADELPVLVTDDFENGMAIWETTDPDPAKPCWKIVEAPNDRGRSTFVLRVLGMSNYVPPHRSPPSVALLKDVTVGDFEINVKVQSTRYPGNDHLDMCLFWGWQDLAHFYYVHLGKKADPHSCQIFIVNDAPRTAITVKQTAGTLWNNRWHAVRVRRRLSDGLIEVFFDDMKHPLMTAQDSTFGAGRVGLGTFDDEGNWDDFELRGVDAEVSQKTNRHTLQR